MSTPVGGSGPGDGPAPAVHLRSRWARRLGAVWFAAAGMWLVGDLVLLASAGRVGWDLLVVPVLITIGTVVGRAALEVDADGLVIHEGLRSHRVLWAAVERIEMDWERRFDAPVRVHLRAEERPLVIQATWRLPPADRERLLAALEPAAAAHDITLDHP